MKENNKYLYDAVIVLGGNIRQTAEGYAPSTYADSDMFGMLGGKIRVIAAALMHLKGEASTFVFSTGTSEKTKAVFGPDVPTEADVYSEDFKIILNEMSAELADADQHDPPRIVLEDKSQNTVGNIRECLQIIQKDNWQKVAFMSTWPHIQRAEALCSVIAEQIPTNANLEFIAAEDIVKRLQPGMYDAEIEAAYNSEEGKKRIASEAKGVRDIKENKYVFTEYQSHYQQAASS